jgi:hypothetical protein
VPTDACRTPACICYTLQDQIERQAKTPLAAAAFRRHYGLEPTGSEAMRLGAEATLEHLVNLHQEGGLFRLSVQRLFEMVCDRFDTRGIHILTPASPSKEFLLGDTPTLTADPATGAVGLAQGAPPIMLTRSSWPLARPDPRRRGRPVQPMPLAAQPGPTASGRSASPAAPSLLNRPIQRRTVAG